MAGCVVVGGGPAGVVLGLLLSRCGVDVVVLEKHADFLRDFRGDTVHASTLGLLDELGLGERFEALPHRMERGAEIAFDDGRVALRFGRLPGRHQHIALVPQWDFLGMLVDSARESPLQPEHLTGPLEAASGDARNQTGRPER
jgi:2-polyprenyl-6-methoxyphenol hydroxylase-like FAD-dependent oxidoreductase